MRHRITLKKAYAIATGLAAAAASLLIVATTELPSYGDVIVPVTLPPQPGHYESLVLDDEFTSVLDYWVIDVGELPNLRLLGEDGDLIVQVRTPNGETLVVNQHPDLASDLEFVATLNWSNGGASTVNHFSLDSSFSFVGGLGNTPTSFRLENASMLATRGSDPLEAQTLFLQYLSSGNPGDWGFTGFDISVPIAQILEHFGDTPTLSPGESALSFGFKLPGNVIGSREASQFTSLAVPEPSIAYLLTSLFVFVFCPRILSRRRDVKIRRI